MARYQWPVASNIDHLPSSFSTVGFFIGRCDPMDPTFEWQTTARAPFGSARAVSSARAVRFGKGCAIEPRLLLAKSTPTRSAWSDFFPF